ncbi:tyrosine-type recombinase/integrase [Pseudomonas monteilii]|uniref:phage integrase n=1 Tax=Pseudomonas monteilii TaxID=76759 RepID=UPI0006DB8D19|nr:tyrosine-type recombinase/integrase [Pseudomonas monteilii]KPM66112.1 integrase [Pseudomonas putida]MBA1318065.1 tyrosine-type recombinase/integrase [Pseudomonas monteilii]MCE1020552.1 tyrosine-type recombinase/integrase [Pseudomonas monteilii]MCE1037880.1 tyrosine-type recombinase/integrase [Pseudomonas monteilii]MCE1090708.1 tyrosine-type recombinase/integrase [Pseudomonas monteilii]
MRPRKTENRDLPPGMYRRKRTRANGKVWEALYYRDSSGKDIFLGNDLVKAKLKWAELEAKSVPKDLTMMKGIFDQYLLKIIPGKATRTQKDNIYELKQLREVFDSAPIDAITPAMIAQYRDSRTAKTRANREIALLSHVFNTAREWGLTTKNNPCLGVRKNKEKPRDYYANEAVWQAVYEEAADELKDAMDLAYLTGQRPADVLSMRKDDMEGIYLLVSQGKTGKRLRIMLQTNGVNNSLGTLLDRIIRRNSEHLSPFFILNSNGKRLSWEMLRNRWQDARESARVKAIGNKQPELANRIAQFQFRDIRPKAASEISDLTDASLLLGHSKEGITERVYRRVGAIAKPSK